MTKTLHPLEEASREELESALQLLALSIVQHRSNCGFVAVRESAAQLANTETGVYTKGRDILEEALVVARRLAQETAEASTEASATKGSVENRRQLRVNVRAPIKLQWDRDGEPVAAQLENISWGGAAIQVQSLPAAAHDRLWVLLPNPRGGQIRIEAALLRTWELEGGQGHGLATRFLSMSTKDEQELENVLELLALSADQDEEGQREHARISQRLEVEFDDELALQATLDDISAGGLGITVPDPLEIGQSLQAVISTMDGSCSLKLRAQVVRQNVIKHGKMEVYHVGLKFEHPSEELRAITNQLIEEMAARRR